MTPRRNLLSARSQFKKKLMVRSQYATPLVNFVPPFAIFSPTKQLEMTVEYVGRTDTTTQSHWYGVYVGAFKFSHQLVTTMSSACCMDVINSGSLRVRNSNCVGSGPYDYCNKAKEVRACPSVMSPETKRLLPPNTETVQTKPFPIRGKWDNSRESCVLLFFSCIH